MAPATQFLFGVLAAFAPGALASCAYGTHLMPRAEAIEEPKFGYFGANSPVNWHGLDAANAACATGTKQSPINMVSDVFTMVPGSELNITIPDFTEGAEFENLGTTVEVIAEEGATINVGETTYSLKQFHFHLPSEHLDNGTSMAMEMHMVWQSEASEIAVIGVYVDISESASSAARRKLKAKAKRAATDSALLETVLGTVDQIPELGNTVKTSALTMSPLVKLLSEGSFQAYSGSLTTPPCSEGVHWFVSTQKLAIKAATFVKARNVIGFNSRFPQNTPGETNSLSLAAASM